MYLTSQQRWYISIVFVFGGLWTSCHSIVSEHVLFLKEPMQIDPIEIVHLDQSGTYIYQPVVVYMDHSSHLFASMLHSRETSSSIIHAIGDGKKFKPLNILHKGGLSGHNQEACSIVVSPEGGYIMTYLSGEKQLMIATSHDLSSWKTIGPAFSESRPCTMGGVIIGHYHDGDFIAKKIDERYWMIWGQDAIHLATSVDLLTWTPLCTPSGALHILFGPGHEGFDTDRLMIGPPPIWHHGGILMLYHGVSLESSSGAEIILPGQAVLDPGDPGKVLARSPMPILDHRFSNRVIQVQSMVRSQDTLKLYASTEDSQLIQIIFSQDL